MSRRRVRSLPVLVAAALACAVPAAAQVPQVPNVQLPNLPTNMQQLGAPATPTITSPRNGATVGSPIVVKGTTTNGAKVHVTATLTAAIPVSGPSTSLGQADATADAKGAWQVSITEKVPVKISGVQIVIEAVATNPVTGQKSASAKVTVTPK